MKMILQGKGEEEKKARKKLKKISGKDRKRSGRNWFTQKQTKEEST